MNNKLSQEHVLQTPEGTLAQESHEPAMNPEHVLIQPEDLVPLTRVGIFATTLFATCGAVLRNTPARVLPGEGLGLSFDTPDVKALYTTAAMCAAATVTTGFISVRNSVREGRREKESNRLKTQELLDQ